MSTKDAKRVVPVLVVMLLSASMAFFLFHTLIASLLTVAVLFSSVAEALLPLTYQLSPEQVTVKVVFFEWLAMPWSDVKSVYATSKGTKLSVFSSPKSARLEPFRGIHLRFPESMRAQVDRYVNEVIAGD